MLQFPEGYFKSEERSGYLVGEAVKRVWASQIEILYKISEICEKYDLTYYIFWGSLLGTVRHQGFIPWDDDIDIAMLGEDYIRFLEIVEKELPEGYHIFNPYTDDELDIHFTRITNRKEIDLVGSWSKEYHGCPLSMGIDIFPLYYIPRDNGMAEEQKQVLSFVKHLKDIINFRKSNPEQNEEEKKENDLIVAQSLVDIQNMTGYRFTTKRPINKQLDLIFDQISRIATREESDCVASFDVYVLRGKCVYELELFAETIQLPFENIEVTAPKEYDKILKMLYGNYMVPRNYSKMDEHHAVKLQIHILGSHLEAVYLQKKNDGNAISVNLQDILRERPALAELQYLLPSEWINKIYHIKNTNEIISRKMVILYSATVEEIMFHSQDAIDKLRRVIDTFSKNPDALLWWFPTMAINEIGNAVEGFIPETLAGYKALVEEFINSNVGIYDESGNITRAILMSDAYYGDEGMIYQIYKRTGKKIMQQKYEI